MGGGAVMRVVGKIAGVVNGSRFLPAFPKILTTYAFQASTTRPITTMLSSFDAQIDNPLPRLVFGGPPTLDEARDATFEVCSALDQAYLSNESSGGSYVSDAKHDKLEVSDSAPKYAIQAFRLLKENPHVQTVVASIACDPQVWTAVMHNEELIEYIKSQNIDSNIPGYQSPKNRFNSFFEDIKVKIEDTTNSVSGFFQNLFAGPVTADESSKADKTMGTFFSTEDSKIPGYHSPEYYDNEMFDEKEPKNGFNSFFEDFKVKTEETMNSISGFFQNLFTGPGTSDGSSKVDKTIGASIMGLAVMVIMVVVLKRV